MVRIIVRVVVRIVVRDGRNGVCRFRFGRGEMEVRCKRDVYMALV